MRHSKRFIELKNKVETDKTYTLKEGIAVVKELANAKFDESVEISIRLGVDPKRSDQMVRGSAVLPHGTGKQKKVLVLTIEKEKEAKEAGADFVGGIDYIEKIRKGWLDFDSVIATPEIMKEVAKLGKILGVRGLMPSPKTGTMTSDVKNAVNEIKRGKINFKMDKTGNIHGIIGKVSFNDENLYENALEFLRGVLSARPSQVKGNYIRSISISSTMGPGIRIDTKDIMAAIK
ncbi:MAG TPA: 50S ribosomal protein L1 [bacterium (Candidatus Stahlbacteria)]|nr:50S ribosomal protein L1 [Candidatus Stahlbacteria bacterium]